MNGCLLVLVCLLCCSMASAQVEMFGWGEARGIRVDGELQPVSTRITVVGRDWAGLAQTGHWRTQDQSYAREGDAIVTAGKVLGLREVPALSFKQTARNLDERTAELEIELTAEQGMEIEGVYLFIGLESDRYRDATAELVGSEGPLIALTGAPANAHFGFGAGAGFRIRSGAGAVEFTMDAPTRITFRDDRETESPRITAFFALHTGTLEAGQVVRRRVTYRVDALRDIRPAHLAIDRLESRLVWEGIGGNFCWGTQSRTVSFYLDQLDLAWARVSFPWNLWHAEESADPIVVALADQPLEIQECIRMARELKRRNIPMIVSVWNAPAWAHRPRERREDSAQQFGRTVRLNPEKRDAIAASIRGYLEFFKREVGEEPAFFSFNEPNLGINVLETPEEHAEHIRLFGEAFEQAGLKTRLLLGDANEPRAVDFITAALRDRAAMGFVGGVSVHSWNDGTDEQLRRWREHALGAGRPLYIAEAGYDPDAHRYRAVLAEDWYAVEEARLNLRCINLAGAASLMHWQLTPDYGLVDEAPDGTIVPTRRWFGYSQIARFTPRGATILAMTSDHPAITAAAFETAGATIIHLANREGEREVTIGGVQRDASQVRAYVTDRDRGQAEVAAASVRDGEARMTLPSQSLVTLVIEP